jgi:hypothetical protein
MSIGQIIGITFSVFIAIVIIVLVILYFIYKKKCDNENQFYSENKKFCGYLMRSPSISPSSDIEVTPSNEADSTF